MFNLHSTKLRQKSSDVTETFSLADVISVGSWRKKKVDCGFFFFFFRLLFLRRENSSILKRWSINKWKRNARQVLMNQLGCLSMVKIKMDFGWGCELCAKSTNEEDEGNQNNAKCFHNLTYFSLIPPCTYCSMILSPSRVKWISMFIPVIYNQSRRILFPRQAPSTVLNQIHALNSSPTEISLSSWKFPSSLAW